MCKFICFFIQIDKIIEDFACKGTTFFRFCKVVCFFGRIILTPSPPFPDMSGKTKRGGGAEITFDYEDKKNKATYAGCLVRIVYMLTLLSLGVGDGGGR